MMTLWDFPAWDRVYRPLLGDLIFPALTTAWSRLGIQRTLDGFLVMDDDILLWPVELTAVYPLPAMHRDALSDSELFVLVVVTWPMMLLPLICM